MTKKAAPASDGGPGTPWRGRSSGPAAPCSVNRLVTIAKQLLGNLDEPRRRHPTPDLIELRNLVVVADLIVRSALSRKESRGLHYTLDYPDMLREAKDTVLTP